MGNLLYPYYYLEIWSSCIVSACRSLRRVRVQKSRDDRFRRITPAAFFIRADRPHPHPDSRRSRQPIQRHLRLRRAVLESPTALRIRSRRSLDFITLRAQDRIPIQIDLARRITHRRAQIQHLRHMHRRAITRNVVPCDVSALATLVSKNSKNRWINAKNRLIFAKFPLLNRKYPLLNAKYPLLKTSRHLLNAKYPLLNPKNHWINAKNHWENPIFPTKITFA